MLILATDTIKDELSSLPLSSIVVCRGGVGGQDFSEGHSSVNLGRKQSPTPSDNKVKLYLK